MMAREMRPVKCMAEECSTHRYADGDVYEGDFKDGNMLGQGVYRYADGSIHYDGKLSSPITTANSSVASAWGGATTTRTPNYWACFMVLSFPLDLVHASRLTCSSLT